MASASKGLNANLAMASSAARLHLALHERVSPYKAGCWERDAPVVDSTHVGENIVVCVTFHPWADPKKEYKVGVTLGRWYGGGWYPIKSDILRAGIVEGTCDFDSEGNITKGNRLGEPSRPDSTYRPKVDYQANEINAYRFNK